MITIMKTYNSPMLHVVSIKKNDIITDSNVPMDYSNESVITSPDAVGAPGRRMFDWYEGY